MIAGLLALGCGGAGGDAPVAGLACAEIAFGATASAPFEGSIRVAFDPSPVDTAAFCPDRPAGGCPGCCSAARGARRLRLLDDGPTARFLRAGFPLRAWRPLADARLTARWTDGRRNVEIGLEALGPDSMRGVAWYEGDPSGVETTTSARARQVPCEDEPK